MKKWLRWKKKGCSISKTILRCHFHSFSDVNICNVPQVTSVWNWYKSQAPQGHCSSPWPWKGVERLYLIIEVWSGCLLPNPLLLPLSSSLLCQGKAFTSYISVSSSATSLERDIKQEEQKQQPAGLCDSQW